MGPYGILNPKIDSAGEAQHQFTRPTDRFDSHSEVGLDAKKSWVTLLAAATLQRLTNKQKTLCQLQL
jgi:hypothetical protein